MRDSCLKVLVLVADDDFVIASTWSDILRLYVYEAESVGSGEEAIDAVRRRPPDALISDAGILCATTLAAQSFIPWTRVFNVKSDLVAAEGGRAFLVLFLWFVANMPLGVAARVQAGFQEGYWSQAVAACGSLMSLAGLVLVVIERGSLPLLVFASILGSILGAFANGWVLFRRRPWLLPRLSAFDAGSARLILKLGLMFFVLQVAASLGYSSDNIVITQMLGAVAVYAVPQKLFRVVSILVAIGLGPMWPAYGEAIARGDTEWVRRTFWNSLRWGMMAVGPMCAILVLICPHVVRIVIGRSLQIPHSLFIVLGVWVVVSTGSNIMSVLLNGASVIKGQAIIAVIAGSSNLALSIFLTRRVGIIGVCLGSIISQLAITIPAYTLLIKDLFSQMPEPTTQHPVLIHDN